MSADLRTIATFSDPIEAELVANRLDEEGIAAAISGDMTSNAFSGLGYTAGGIDVLVPAAELDRARTILANFAKEIEAKKHPPPHAITAAPPIPEMQEPSREAEPGTTVADKEVEKAFRAMLLGLLILPVMPVSHFYAVILLIHVVISGEGMRSISSIKYLATLGISVLGVLFSGFAFVMLFFVSPFWLLMGAGPSVLLFLFMILWPGRRRARVEDGDDDLEDKTS